MFGLARQLQSAFHVSKTTTFMFSGFYVVRNALVCIVRVQSVCVWSVFPSQSSLYSRRIQKIPEDGAGLLISIGSGMVVSGYEVKLARD